MFNYTFNNTYCTYLTTVIASLIHKITANYIVEHKHKLTTYTDYNYKIIFVNKSTSINV